MVHFSLQPPWDVQRLSQRQHLINAQLIKYKCLTSELITPDNCVLLKDLSRVVLWNSCLEGGSDSFTLAYPRGGSA